MDKRTPQRTCVGCGRTTDKSSLVRIAAGRDDKSGEISSLKTDPEGRLPGRGAYLCRDISCLKLAIKKKGFNRTFRQALRQDLLDELEGEFINMREAYEDR